MVACRQECGHRPADLSVLERWFRFRTPWLVGDGRARPVLYHAGPAGARLSFPAGDTDGRDHALELPRAIDDASGDAHPGQSVDTAARPNRFAGSPGRCPRALLDCSRVEAPQTDAVRIGKAAWLTIGGAGALAAGLLTAHPAHAALHHAALLIQHSGGSVITRCVAFAEAQISGLQLVERSGVEYQAQNFGSIGSAMCQLDREPSSVPPGCFGSGAYWQYFHRQGASWQASAVGASSSVLRDGDMDGWHYASGTGQAPGAASFASVCGAPSPPVAVTHTTLPKAPVPSSAAAAGAPHAATPTPAPPVQALAPSPTLKSALAASGPP